MNYFATLPAASVLLALLVLPVPAGAISVVSSPHNLATGGEKRICIFCHTPHHATLLSDPKYTGPLWNRDEITDPGYYTPYISSTITVSSGKAVRQPQGPSRLCLSCHDGTIALSSALHGIKVNLPALTGRTVLGRDLRDDHPISIEYDLLRLGNFADADAVTSTTRVKLMDRNGVRFVECTSCHDPHDNQFGNFLVVDTAVKADAICTICHTPNNWTNSSHKTAPTLNAQGCTACHAPHGAQQGDSLLKVTVAGGIDTNCTASCHNGTVGRAITSFSHVNGADPAGTKHKGAENLALAATWGADPLPVLSENKHVHCVDCHNPHQAQTSPAVPPTPPDVNGVLKGVRGVDIIGNPRSGATPYAQTEYEICFRCHSGASAYDGAFSNVLTRVSRIFTSWDERERFDFGTAKSWHPVAATFSRVGISQGLSLKDSGMTTIYCDSCHDPHGSARQHLLRKDNQDTFLQGQGTSFDLCYSCHNETYLLTTSSNVRLRRLHVAHIMGIHQSGNSIKASCSNCHDPHGVPYKGGVTTAVNSLHLVNFDTRFAGVGSSYQASNLALVSTSSCTIVAGTLGSCHPTTANPANMSIYDTYSP
jgi:predicted CXXCH cytochrome family protein